MRNTRIIPSAGAGQCEVNGNIAKVVTAIFKAAGEDIACVHESPTRELHIEPDNTDIYASLLVPGLTISALVADEFTLAHNRPGRNQPASPVS